MRCHRGGFASILQQFYTWANELARYERRPIAEDLADDGAAVGVTGGALGAAGDERHQLANEGFEHVAAVVGGGDTEHGFIEIVSARANRNDIPAAKAFHKKLPRLMPLAPK